MECCQTKPRHTTHHQHLPEKVTIVRARHPFDGRSLNVLEGTHRKGRLHLVLILPDGSKSLIPADWTDLALPVQLRSTPPTSLGSLQDLLHARAVVNALLGRIALATDQDNKSPATKESKLERKKPKTLRSLLDETYPWQTWNEEHQTLAVQILARLIAQTALRNQQGEKNHE